MHAVLKCLLGLQLALQQAPECADLSIQNMSGILQRKSLRKFVVVLLMRGIGAHLVGSVCRMFAARAAGKAQGGGRRSLLA